MVARILWILGIVFLLFVIMLFALTENSGAFFMALVLFVGGLVVTIHAQEHGRNVGIVALLIGLLMFIFYLDTTNSIISFIERLFQGWPTGGVMCKKALPFLLVTAMIFLSVWLWWRTADGLRTFFAFISGTLTLLGLGYLIWTQFAFGPSLTRFWSFMFPTDIAILAAILTAVFCGLTLWKHSKIFLVLTLIFACSWLGSDKLSQIFNRVPGNPMPISIQKGWSSMWNGIGKRMDRLGKELGKESKTAPPPKQTTSAMSTSGATAHASVAPPPVPASMPELVDSYTPFSMRPKQVWIARPGLYSMSASSDGGMLIENGNPLPPGDFYISRPQFVKYGCTPPCTAFIERLR
jgi:hypothetical protein